MGSIQLLAKKSKRRRIDESLRYYFIFVTFALVYMHPMVSTYCFNALYCDPIYFDTVQVQYWLNPDKGVNCESAQWYIFATAAWLVILIYVLGMPIGLIMVTCYLHEQKEVKIKKRSLYVPSSQIRMERRRGGGEMVEAERENKSSSGKDDNCGPGADHDSRPRSSAATCVFHYSIKDTVTGEIITIQPVFLPGVQPGSGKEGIQNRLADPAVLQYIGGYTTSFKPQFFYWMGYEILVRLFQTSMVIVVRLIDEKYDLGYMCITTTLALGIHAHVQPYISQNVNLVQTLTFLGQAWSCIGYLTVRDIDDDNSSHFVGICLISTQVLVGALVSTLVFREMSHLLKDQDSLIFEMDHKLKRQATLIWRSITKKFS
eukprot:gene1262-1844_t